jgi:hypothetical protein
MTGLDTRAILRPVNTGSEARCWVCAERIKFNAKDRRQLQVIANVYEDGVWRRVEHFHPSPCYDERHGEATY